MALSIENHRFAWLPNGKNIQYRHYDMYNNLSVVMALKNDEFQFNFIEKPDENTSYSIPITDINASPISGLKL